MAEQKPFDPQTVTVNELKHQPIAVVKTELPALAKALGVEPAELFKSLAGRAAAVDGDCRCCGNDSW